MVGSERTAVPWIQATGRSLLAAAAAEPMTMAAAPSDEGQVSAYRMGSQSSGESRMASSVMSSWCKWA